MRNVLPKTKMLKIREMEEADIFAAAEIEAENFSRPWSADGFLSAVKDTKALYLVAESDGMVVGYIGMWIALDEGEITNVSVKKELQGQKIGAELMKGLVEAGTKQGVLSYFLEVRESNERAVRLYKSFGFQQVGLRKNFYEAPVEHAVVMCKR